MSAGMGLDWDAGPAPFWLTWHHPPGTESGRGKLNPGSCGLGSLQTEGGTRRVAAPGQVVPLRFGQGFWPPCRGAAEARSYVRGGVCIGRPDRGAGGETGAEPWTLWLLFEAAGWALSVRPGSRPRVGLDSRPKAWPCDLSSLGIPCSSGPNLVDLGVRPWLWTCCF